MRVLYDRYVSQHDAHAVSTQKLLFPETVQFSPAEAVQMNQILPELSRLGFDLADLGGNTFAVNGIPAGLEGIDPKSLLHEMVEETSPSHPLTPSLSNPLTSHLSLRLAQSAAIPYGQILNNDEMESLINELFTCSNVNYTPDGKAILCILPQGDIEHLLG